MSATEPHPSTDPAPDPAPADVLPEQDEPHRRRLPSRRTLALAVLAPLAVLLALAGVAYAATDVPVPKADAKAQVSVVQWSDGSEMARIGALNRIDVPLAKVSVEAQHAVLAAEDRGFYSNPGISLTGIARAALANVRGGGVEQGASTITQQYVKNAYLTRERTLSRKMKEVLIAVKLDRTKSKDQVLEDYLNTVYFGRGAYGIEVAAQTWFGKPAAKLTASEGAVLAALLRSPSGYDPAQNPNDAKGRWAYVLGGMAEQGWLEGDPAAVAYPEVKPKQNRSKDLTGPKGYLVQHVQDELAENGFSEARLNGGGLRIRTTFDKKAQAAAVEAVQEVSGEKAPEGVRRALVAVEPGTGRVLAQYAGDDYVTRPFNDVTQGSAQAGSSFKPYVLAAALDKGMSLKAKMNGASPQRFGDYEVRNYGPGKGEQFSDIDLVDATVHSVNTVYVPLGQQAGTSHVTTTAAALGIRADMTKERDLPSVSLGVTAVRPLDQAVAYATLAARGTRADPYVVEEVKDVRGSSLYKADVRTEQVLRTGVADDTSFALQEVVKRGTGRRSQLDGRPSAGKTGTTSGNTAAWFVGYTPQLAAAVTLFSADSDVALRDVAGVDEVTGGSLPAMTWQRFMSAALKGAPVKAFAPPPFGGDAPTPSPSPSASASASPSPSASPSASPTPSVQPSPEILVAPPPQEQQPGYTYEPPADSAPAPEPPPPAEEDSGGEQYAPPEESPAPAAGPGKGKKGSFASPSPSP